MKTNTKPPHSPRSAATSPRRGEAGVPLWNSIAAFKPHSSPLPAGGRSTVEAQRDRRVGGFSGSRRPGFTLIELLVVMGLIILLAAITITVSYSGLIDNYRTIGAGDRVSKWLVIAKVKAQRDQSPCGVRFYADASGMIREAQYIEAPNAYVPVSSAADKSPPLITINKAAANTVTLTNIDPTTLGNNVQPGDTLVLPEFRTLLKVLTVSGGTITLVTPTLLPDIGSATKYSTTAFGFLRAARPMVGEEMLLLTGQTAISGPIKTSPTTLGPSLSLADFVINPDGSVTADVLFNPNGEVLGTTRGTVILWIRDPSLLPMLPANGSRPQFEQAGQMGLVTVYTKTGSIATHPVLLPPNDVYGATKDGINTGL